MPYNLSESQYATPQQLLDITTSILGECAELRKEHPALVPIFFSMVASCIKTIAETLGCDLGVCPTTADLGEPLPTHVTATYPEDQPLYDQILAVAVTMKEISEILPQITEEN